MQRSTIQKPVTIEGIGLHKGSPIVLNLKPSDAGLIFVRAGVQIPATAAYVVDTRLNTTLGNAGLTLATVEHCLSACAGLGLTDATIEVAGDEMPALDGSARLFAAAILKAGLEPLAGTYPELKLHETVRVEQGDSFVEARPGSFRIAYSIDFAEKAIGSQSFVYAGDDYLSLIAPARTFGRLKDIETMRSLGLSLGGSLENAVVVDEDQILNPEGLRFADEFVRHKILDLLGDLWTLGATLEADIRAHKASHRLHIELVRQLAGLVRR